MQILLLVVSLLAAPAVALAQPGVTAQANLAALEKILIGEDTRNADLIREAMSGGA